MTAPTTKLAGEGALDLAVCRRLARETGMCPGDEYGLRGKDHLDQRIRGYNAAARFEPWIVLRDLDHDEICGASLARTVLPNPAPFMRFRVVVRSIEAWIMADHNGFSGTFSVTRALLPRIPENEPDPKSAMLRLLSRSASRDVRDGLVRQRAGKPLEIGPEYNVQLSAFVEDVWQPASAAENCRSFAKAILRMREMAAAFALSRRDQGV